MERCISQACCFYLSWSYLNTAASRFTAFSWPYLARKWKQCVKLCMFTTWCQLGMISLSRGMIEPKLQETDIYGNSNNHSAQILLVATEVINLQIISQTHHKYNMSNVPLWFNLFPRNSVYTAYPVIEMNYSVVDTECQTFFKTWLKINKVVSSKKKGMRQLNQTATSWKMKSTCSRGAKNQKFFSLDDVYM